MNRRPLARKATIQTSQTSLQVSVPIALSDGEWLRFREQVFKKYAHGYAPVIYGYARKYYPLLTDISGIENISATTRNNAIKSLIVLSKFLGVREEFRNAMKSCGIKLSRPDCLAAFTRLYTNSNGTLDLWINQAATILRPEERLFLRFLKLSGLRAGEGIRAFNKVITLSLEGRLTEYWNNGILEHFKFRSEFLRGTKNCYISILPSDLIAEISQSHRVSYNGLLKRLQRHGLKCRISELRDYFGTFAVQHGIVAQEADLLCGRIPPSIFVRHYFSPAIAELKNRVLKALTEMEAPKILQEA